MEVSEMKTVVSKASVEDLKSVLSMSQLQVLHEKIVGYKTEETDEIAIIKNIKKHCKEKLAV